MQSQARLAPIAVRIGLLQVIRGLSAQPNVRVSRRHRRPPGDTSAEIKSFYGFPIGAVRARGPFDTRRKSDSVRSTLEHTTFAISVLIGAIGASPCVAQSRVTSLEELRRELAAGDFITVVPAVGQPFAGRLMGLDDVDLSVRLVNKRALQERGPQDLTLPLDAIQSLERPRDSARNGAAGPLSARVSVERSASGRWSSLMSLRRTIRGNRSSAYASGTESRAGSRLTRLGRGAWIRRWPNSRSPASFLGEWLTAPWSSR